MDDTGLGSFWLLAFPRFGEMLSGRVEAVTPWLVLLIWGVAAFVVSFAAREAIRATRLVRRTERLLNGVTPESLYGARVEMARNAQLAPPPVRDAWREFNETLVAEDRRLYNTVAAAEYFNEQRFAPRLVGNRFLHAAPTALTTLGLLGTFLGLTVGLRGLDLGSTSDELRVGIQTLVDGAALGFTASLWGVFMSLVTNVSERSLERSVVKKIQRLQDRIDRLFSMKSPEQSLSDIAASTAESKEALQILHEKIGSALQESVQNVGEITSRAVSDAIESSLAPVMQEIAQKAANQSADVFREVSAQLTSSFHQIGTQLAEQLRESSDSMRATLDYMGAQLARQADEHLTRMSALEEATTAQLRAVDEATTRQLNLLDRSLPPIVEGLDRSALLVGSATAGMQQVTTGLERVSTGMAETSSQLGRTLGEALGTMERLAGQATSAARALEQQQAGAGELLAQASSAARSLETASATLIGGFDGMRTSQAAFLEDLERQLHRHSTAMSAWLSAYGDEVQKQTGNRMAEWNRHTEGFTSLMITATQAMSDVVDELGSQRPYGEGIVTA